MPITKEDFDRIQLANPGVPIEVLCHPTLPDQIIARPPNVDQWAIYKNLLAEKKYQEAYRTLIGFCSLFPSPGEVTVSLDARPALAEVWAGELAELAGFSTLAYRKKF